MPIVSSFGALTSTPAPVRWTPTNAVSLFTGSPQTYAALYRTQPNVRICVDFLARNVAQLGLHTFRRITDNGRVRLYDHGLAQTTKRPNPRTSR